MMHQLFGNSSIEKILFYLLINGKCYAGKLARHFKTALTPMQKGLAKLEEIGLIESYLEGKMRYYEFNQNCPFLIEFEAFLRKMYMLLPTSEKQAYYLPETQKTKTRPRRNGFIHNVWGKLPNIKSLSFSASSQNPINSGWNGVGKGKVEIIKSNDNTLIFHEKGSWVSRDGQKFSFKNVFRWTFDKFQNLITLEHLRFGEQNPVFLFHLAQTDEETLESVSSYVCKEDTYLGQVKCDDHSIQLNWRILGPKKNEAIDYLYT